MFKDDRSDHFRAFANDLARTIERRGGAPKNERERFASQKGQVEALVAAEDAFRSRLVEHPLGVAAYEQFVRYVCEERRNILFARPFFRTRQQFFTDHISAVFKRRDAVGLQGFPVNYMFVRFVTKRQKLGSKLVAAGRVVEDLRRGVIEDNLPLVINRARLFFSRTPRSHLTYMDLIEIAVEGLIAAVDKYVVPDTGFSTAFRSVACGRMTGNFIDHYSETLIRFVSNDRRRIYRANKHLSRAGGEVDYERIAEEVNRVADEKSDPVKTTPAEIAGLLAAVSTVSLDPAGPSEGASPVASAAAPESSRPDVLVEEEEVRRLVAAAIESLPLLQRKVLRLHGVDFGASRQLRAL